MTPSLFLLLNLKKKKEHFIGLIPSLPLASSVTLSEFPISLRKKQDKSIQYTWLFRSSNDNVETGAFHNSVSLFSPSKITAHYAPSLLSTLPRLPIISKEIDGRHFALTRMVL